MQILCATDFSKPSRVAADVAAALARRMGLPLRLMHCGHDWSAMGEVPVELMDESSVRARLKSEGERLRATGIAVQEELRYGGISMEIIASASEQPTKLIVLGSVGRGMAARWLIGSVAERVAEGAPVPTLVVRQPELLIAWLKQGTPLKTLAAVDLTASSDAAVTMLQSFAALGHMEVEATYVRPPEAPIDTEEQRTIRQRDVWDRVHAVLGDIPIKVHVCDRICQPAVGLLLTADEHKSGLLAIGTHQRHGWQRLKAPSVSRSVLVHAVTNVLCVPVTAVAPSLRVPVIHRVLVATDLTDTGLEALRYAHSLLPSGGSIHLVHICREPSRGINPVIASEIYFDHSLATAKAREEAEEKIKDLPGELMTAPGVNVTSEVLAHDDIAVAIEEAAERCGAEVICLGSKGHSRAGIALLGSTVQGVLARSSKPVLVIKAPRS